MNLSPPWPVQIFCIGSAGHVASPVQNFFPMENLMQRNRQELKPDRAGTKDQQTGPQEAPLSPGDEAAPGTTGSGEDICPACKGSGKSAEGNDCPNCSGSGRVIEGIGGG
jgi:hypothetical protein